jgi:hypothetical protein
MARKVVRRAGPKPKPKAKAKPKAKSANSGNGRRMDAKALKAKYPHLVNGTLEFDETLGKQTVEIKCAGGATTKTCKNPRRRVATSDLFQVTRCEEHTLEVRRANRAKARASA